jgi:hypothetical protein
LRDGKGRRGREMRRREGRRKIVSVIVFSWDLTRYGRIITHQPRPPRPLVTGIELGGLDWSQLIDIKAIAACRTRLNREGGLQSRTHAAERSLLLPSHRAKTSETKREQTRQPASLVLLSPYWPVWMPSWFSLCCYCLGLPSQTLCQSYSPGFVSSSSPLALCTSSNEWLNRRVREFTL